ncbi:unnamed protein product [Mytilus edulis]|uniref:Uncharacterized protein n=1 Tax=Mytilus edulis TaxID=6550 RepID=A0A8S3VD66_MYTED|nr:unnamed protein product [Mytilus edulis]
MHGFKLYVTNTSRIPPDGYLCYADPDFGSPDIRQTIPCNQIGKYVIYYDTKGTVHDEIIYVDNGHGKLFQNILRGCPPSHFGHVCNESCPRNCQGPCDLETGKCTFGCLNGWIGETCDIGKTIFALPEQQHYDDVELENISTYQDLQMISKSNEYDGINIAYSNPII